VTAFVLVHGAWHGGWVWEATADVLRDAGDVVWAPTLRGCAERARSTPDRRYAEIQTAHDAMLTHPVQLSVELRNMVSGVAVDDAPGPAGTIQCA